MKIQLLHNYKGLPNHYELLKKGEQDVSAELGQYLIENGHALSLEVEIETKPVPAPQTPKRKAK